jgi:uncharacterized protein
MKLDRKLVVVTGASRGFGAATARLLAKRGARMVLLARGEQGLATTAAEIREAGGRAAAMAVDLTDPMALGEVAERVRREHGDPEVLVNCAGTGAFRFVDETAPGEAQAMIGAPYLAAFHVVREFVPKMIERRAGHILNVTSAVAFCPIPGATAYGAACWALRGFTESLRADLFGLDIGITLFVAGTSSTPGYEHYPGVEERTPKVARILPRTTPERVGEKIARAIETNRSLAVEPPSVRLLLALGRIAPRVAAQLSVRTGTTWAAHHRRR